MNPFHNRPDEWAYYLPLVGNTMLEFGGKINGLLTYKAFFETQGFRHVSLDWNGQHGALVRDLRQPQWPEFGQFDMVCNIGTSEHVSDQRGFWRNVHMLTKVGGVYVGQCPYHDGRSWWWHGEWYPTEEFYWDFADFNGWTIERIGTDRPEPFKNLYCRLRKTQDLPFVMPDLSLIKFNQRQARRPAPAGCAEPS
jgi:SAM-dependent methyltransferase